MTSLRKRGAAPGLLVRAGFGSRPPLLPALLVAAGLLLHGLHCRAAGRGRDDPCVDRKTGQVGPAAACRRSARPAWALRSEDSRFGVDYVFPLLDRFQDERWAEVYAATGAGWVNFAMVEWASIEPVPPGEGGHHYQWDRLDRAVRSWQRHGFSLVFSLRLGRGWFSGPARYAPRLGGLFYRLMYRNSDRLPAGRHLDDLSAWISAMVERYDCDGKEDMPGLLRPVAHYQVGNEYANPAFWTGTADDYAVLLRTVAAAARNAFPSVRIVSNGIRWNDIFVGDPSGRLFEARFRGFVDRLPSDEWKKAWRRARRFTEYTVSLAGNYDILDAGGNGPYAAASSGYMAWVRRGLEEAGAAGTLVWDMEARCEPQLAAQPQVHFLPRTVPPWGPAVLKILKRRFPPPDEALRRWYRNEMSRILAKVFVLRFAAGFQKVFMGMPDDWDGTWAAWSTPNPFLGLCNGDAEPWPAFYAMSLLVRKLDGFRRVEPVPAGRGVVLHRFTFTDRPPVYVAWSEGDDSLPPAAVVERRAGRPGAGTSPGRDAMAVAGSARLRAPGTRPLLVQSIPLDRVQAPRLVSPGGALVLDGTPVVLYEPGTR